MIKMFDWLRNKIEFSLWSKREDKERSEENSRSVRKKWPLWAHRLHNHGLGSDPRKLGVVVGDQTLDRFQGYRLMKIITNPNEVDD